MAQMKISMPKPKLSLILKLKLWNQCSEFNIELTFYE